MNGPIAAPGILILCHGSPREEANRRFVNLVERIAARLAVAHVLPIFLSTVRPSIADGVAELATRGVRRIVLLPYFLAEGRHAAKDLPELISECSRALPDVAVEILPTLENDPALEDLVVDRLLPWTELAGPPSDAAAQARSEVVVQRQLSDWPTDPAARSIVRRVIHATADVSFARTLRIHPDAVARGRAALAAHRPVLCDGPMLQAGISRTGSEVVVASVWEEAVPQLDGSIVAIGSEPATLWKVLETARCGGPRPALVVGMPVGLVGARESKLALVASELCYICNTTGRGGPSVAAAVVNALAELSL